ncbi:hypothetical protein Micbo1qcDRAFT_109286, partial [Microdochium bolleyi]
LGWGPRDAQLGDELWVLPGCLVPVVLRPNGNEGGQRIYVGPCLVPGLMRGEA